MEICLLLITFKAGSDPAGVEWLEVVVGVGALLPQIELSEDATSLPELEGCVRLVCWTAAADGGGTGSVVAIESGRLDPGAPKLLVGSTAVLVVSDGGSAGPRGGA